MKQLTLVYLIREDALCLGYKKRGFGSGNWNGFGGKVEEGEAVRAAAVREVQEEISVGVAEEALAQVAYIEFFFKDGSHLCVSTFFVRDWDGEPKETDEMRPAWFLYNAIPYGEMWADDVHWLPRALAGERLKGKVWFAENGTDIEKMEWVDADTF